MTMVAIGGIYNGSHDSFDGSAKELFDIKMKNIIVIAALFAIPFLSGCALGPLVSHETGRTVGQGHHEVMGGYGTGGFVLKWNVGVLERFDVGLHWESLSVGIRAKYAIINGRTEGWSAALAGGIGSSVGGSHYYGDIIGSYYTGSWEPYGTVRFVRVKTDPTRITDKESGNVLFTISSVDYNYGNLILGTRYWFTENWLLSAEASTLFSMSSGLRIGSGFLIGAAFGYRF